jgi:hypothetical protein
MTRCERCDLPIEAEDLIEDENPDDPLQPLHYHHWCHPDFQEKFPSEPPPSADAEE